MSPPLSEPTMDTGTGMLGASGPRARMSWRLPEGELDLSRPRVMGILNVTPDSFSDGGLLATVEAAVTRARLLVEEGAALLDIGGESTRPGAASVPVEEELERVLPVIEETVRSLGVPVSVDTRKADVAREALRMGAQIVNDVSGLKHDPRMARVVAEAGGAVVISHMRGTPATMMKAAVYDDVVAEIVEELNESLSLALAAGISRESIIADPGIGFAKTPAQSLTLIRRLESLAELGLPVLVGPSRKSFLGEITGLPPEERVPGTIVACILAYLRGARVFRVHDVAPVVQGLDVARAILGEEDSGRQHRTREP